jgi:hypothetical protein
MQLPINADKLTFTVTGDVTPVLVYGTTDAKKDSQGRPLYRVPVIIGGTGSKYDPSSNVTIPGPVVNIQRGQVKFRNLQISTWTIRGNDGKERSGVTLRAEGVEQAKA